MTDSEQLSSDGSYKSEEENRSRIPGLSSQRQKRLKTEHTEIPNTQEELQKVLHEKVVELHVKIDQLIKDKLMVNNLHQMFIMGLKKKKMNLCLLEFLSHLFNDRNH